MEKLLEIVAAEDGTEMAMVPPAETLPPNTMILHRTDVPLPSYAAVTYTGDAARPPTTFAEEKATKEALRALRQEFRDMFKAIRARAEASRGVK